jgi:hypothetical protein
LNLIIDKNVLIAACTGKNPNGKTDATAIGILSDVVICTHRLIVTREIENDYIRIFDKMKNPQGPDTLLAPKFYFEAEQIGKVDKTRTNTELPAVQDEGGIKPEDLPFARLANITGATLVTYDGPLLQKLGGRAKLPQDVIELSQK